MSTEETNRLLHEISMKNCQQAFRQLFDFYYPRMFEISKFYVRVNHLAEEVVADVFIKFWRNRSSVSQIQNFHNYLFIAVKRQSLNKLRDYNSNLFYIDSLEHDTIVEHRSPEKDVFTAEYLEYISRCIQKLPEKCRLIFKMAKEDHMSYKQIAEVTGLAPKTVEMHISHALKQLRIDIQKYKNYHQNAGYK